MSGLVKKVVTVSDGILVEVGTGECCYYPATFLLEHLLTESNHVFLNYDPCAGGDGDSLARLSVVATGIAALGFDV